MRNENRGNEYQVKSSPKIQDMLGHLVVFRAREFVPCIEVPEFNITLQSRRGVLHKLLPNNDTVVITAHDQHLAVAEALCLLFRGREALLSGQDLPQALPRLELPLPQNRTVAHTRHERPNEPNVVEHLPVHRIRDGYVRVRPGQELHVGLSLCGELFGNGI